MYARKAATTTAVRLVPSERALCMAGRHTSSGIRMARNGVGMSALRLTGVNVLPRSHRGPCALLATDDVAMRRDRRSTVRALRKVHLSAGPWSSCLGKLSLVRLNHVLLRISVSDSEGDDRADHLGVLAHLLGFPVSFLLGAKANDALDAAFPDELQPPRAGLSLFGHGSIVLPVYTGVKPFDQETSERVA